MIELNEAKVRFVIATAEGSLRAAAELLRVQRIELTGYVAQRPDLQEFIQDVREEIADDSQAYLGEAVEAGLPWAIKYTLTKLGASRGYAAQRVVKEQISLHPTPDSLLPIKIALEQARGHVTYAARTLGKTRADVKKLIADSPALQMVLFQERESLADHAETALHHAVRAKKPWAIMFTLSTLRRDHGYGRPSKRAASSSEFRVPSSASPQVPDAGDQQSGTGSSKCRVPSSASPQASRAEKAPDSPNTPNHAQRILIGAPAERGKEEPAPDILSQVVARLSRKKLPIPTRRANVARNAPCPCNSGLKYKRCCGA